MRPPRRSRSPACVTVDVGDRRVYERADGFAHRAFRVPNTTATRFAIASGGKTFTALAVLRLVEEGVLSLDTKVRGILGADLPLIDDEVTVEHLLTHTSGIGDYLDEEADWDAADYVLPVPVHVLAETEAFVPVIDGFPQAFAPGGSLRVLQRRLHRARPHRSSARAAGSITTSSKKRSSPGPD